MTRAEKRAQTSAAREHQISSWLNILHKYTSEERIGFGAALDRLTNSVSREIQQAPQKEQELMHCMELMFARIRQRAAELEKGVPVR